MSGCVAIGESVKKEDKGGREGGRGVPWCNASGAGQKTWHQHQGGRKEGKEEGREGGREEEGRAYLVVMQAAQVNIHGISVKTHSTHVGHTGRKEGWEEGREGEREGGHTLV